MVVKRLHFHRRKFRIFGNFFFVKNSIECISHVDIYSLDNRFLLAVSWKLQDSLILSPITRDVVSIAPSSTATCIQRVLHPDVVVALESMSLLIGLKHIDTFSIIKNKRSKKKGERRNDKSILVNDSLNRSNSLNPDSKFKFISILVVLPLEILESKP